MSPREDETCGPESVNCDNELVPDYRDLLHIYLIGHEMVLGLALVSQAPISEHQLLLLSNHHELYVDS